MRSHAKLSRERRSLFFQSIEKSLFFLALVAVELRGIFRQRLRAVIAWKPLLRDRRELGRLWRRRFDNWFSVLSCCREVQVLRVALGDQDTDADVTIGKGSVDNDPATVGNETCLVQREVRRIGDDRTQVHTGAFAFPEKRV